MVPRLTALTNCRVSAALRRGWCFLVVASSLTANWSCGTDAVGVGACREIEYARCEAAVSCGMIDDAESCKQYYQDHCLHGVDLDEGPRSVAVGNCVSAIRAAGRCADRQDDDTPPEDCDSSWLEDADARRVCDVVAEPERAPACEFLVADPEEEAEEDDEAESDDRGDAEDAGADPSDAG